VAAARRISAGQRGGRENSFRKPRSCRETRHGSLDPVAKRGSRTRLLRFRPGVFTTKPFVHDYWEEVFLLQGDLTVGNDENGEGGEPFSAFTYACRPPGVYHGPFRSNGGCLLLETHYYDPA